jgi:hypothetical protein
MAVSQQKRERVVELETTKDHHNEQATKFEYLIK